MPSAASGATPATTWTTTMPGSQTASHSTVRDHGTSRRVPAITPAAGQTGATRLSPRAASSATNDTTRVRITTRAWRGRSSTISASATCRTSPPLSV